MASDVRELTLDSIRSLTKRGTKDLRLLALAAFCVWFGFGAYNATAVNFAVQLLNIQPYQQGILEAARETPGFLLVLMAALTMRVSESLLGSLALILVGMGMAAYFGIHSFASLIVYSLVWSVGLHMWMTIQPSMVLSLAGENQKGRRLGQMAAVASLGTILGMAMVLAIGKWLGMRATFVVAGAVIGLGAVSAFFISRDIGNKEKPRFVWKRRYSLYYMLTFLEGCRKQVFMTFAIFALVRNYHTGVQMVAVLMIFNNLVNITLAPKVGRLIDRIGERKVLAFCYAALIPVFIGYATIKHVHVLYLLYCLDNLFFLGSIGLNTYLHKIADPEDVMPSIAMGVSMNHTAAVAVPVIGGYLWSRFNYPTTFFGGAVVVAISVIFALRMKVGKPANT
jgi:predicted MFS family arabinose efflux permease